MKNIFFFQISIFYKCQLKKIILFIPTVLNRIKVRLIDTEIRLDNFTNDKDRGITVICKIKRLALFVSILIIHLHKCRYNIHG